MTELQQVMLGLYLFGGLMVFGIALEASADAFYKRNYAFAILATLFWPIILPIWIGMKIGREL